jgi:hypothetical protein
MFLLCKMLHAALPLLMWRNRSAFLGKGFAGCINDREVSKSLSESVRKHPEPL